MKKEELFKELNKIMLETNGGVDDYVVALCQISNLVNDYAEEHDYRIAVLERALKLACEPRDDWSGKEYDEPYTNYYDYFLDQAEKEVKDGDIA